MGLEAVIITLATAANGLHDGARVFLEGQRVVSSLVYSYS